MFGLNSVPIDKFAFSVRNKFLKLKYEKYGSDDLGIIVVGLI